MMRQFTTALIVFVFCFSPLATHAEELTPDQILARMDTNYNSFKDQEMDVELTVINTDGKEKSYRFSIKQLGGSKRLVRFTSGEVKGMSILTENQNRMYVYLPAYKKVRRIASHNMNQSFMGSDFSNADMATASYKELYRASLHKEDDEYWYLKLVPKDKDDVAYTHLIMKIGKKRLMQWQIEYYKDSEKVKLLQNTALEQFKGVKTPWHTRVIMSDPRTGHKTILKVLDLKVNQGLKKRMFTTRQLKWGR